MLNLQVFSRKKIERSANGSALNLIEACKTMELPSVAQGIRHDCMMNLDMRIARELDDVANVISQNAADIIHEAALLLQLGVVDPVYAQASTTANKILYLVNMYRGQNLQGEAYEMTLDQKKCLIAEAQAQFNACSNQASLAKQNNTLNIERALEKQKQLTRSTETILGSLLKESASV